MGIAKQILLSLLVLVAAAAAWARWVPGAAATLEGWGVDPAVVAAIAPAQPEGEAAGTGGGARGSGGPGAGGPGRGGPPQAVIARAVGEATINDRLSAIGTGRAVVSVDVKPFSAGRLTAVEASSGQTVEKGAVLARLDSETEEIAVDRARIALEDASARVERIRQLQRSNTATSVQVTEAELAESNAALELRSAELALERRSIVSPISGIVGIIPVEAGDIVASDTVVAAVDDRSSIIVDFWVPERFASLVEVGAALTAEPVARAQEATAGTVSAVDTRIDEASRTLRVQARIPNPDDRFRAGQSFRVAMRFPGDTYASVDPLAIQWGTDGAFVWAVRDGKAARTPVRIVQRNTESVLVEAALQPGDSVVTEGVHAVREGGNVLVADAEAPAAAIPASDNGAARRAPGAEASAL